MSRQKSPAIKPASPQKVAKRTPKPKVVLVFGENASDTNAIRALTEGLAPDLKQHVQVRRQPLVLLHKMDPRTRTEWAERLAAVVRADAVIADVRGVLKHEDCDAIEPAHVSASITVEQALRAAGVEHVHPVTPAWEIEAWWFLFPDAVKVAFPSWRKPPSYAGKSVGHIADAKERFARAVRPLSAKPTFRGYRESDSVRIAEHVRDRGEAATPQGRSASYDAFRSQVAACAKRFSNG